MKKLWVLIILIISSFLLTGCWDMVEINQRLFVSSIGIDLNPEEGMDKYIVTFVYPNISAIGKDASDSKERFVVSTPSSSIFNAGKEFSIMVDFPFYYKHVKVLVVGEELSKDDKLMRQIIDSLNRDTKINKKVQVLIADGRAEDVLSEEHEGEQVTEGYIYNILKDSKSASKFTSKSLTGVIRDSDFCCVTVVPKIVRKKNQIEISGGAILENYGFLGWIDAKENRALSFMTDKVKTELIDVPYKGDIISYAITNSKTDKKVVLDKEIKVDLKIELDGYLQGYTIGEGKNVGSNRVLKDMGEHIEKKLKKEIEDTIKLLQKEYNADVIGVGEYISKFYPNEWEELKPIWKDIFPEVKFNVVVDTEIRRTGLTR